jgi:hypothetical protein
MKLLLQNPVGVLKYLLLTGMFLSCGNSIMLVKKQTGIDIPYPQPHADSTAIIFLPGIVSKDSFDFNATFSPDGKSFYFSRSINRQSNIYVTHFNGVKWTEPTAVPISAPNSSDADPAFAPDGKLYFISNRPVSKSDTTHDYDIWYSTPQEGGSWSAPENLKSINSDSNEYYVSFAENGNLYFASSRTGGFGEEDIYVSKLVNGKYSSPENLGAAINSPKPEYDPCILPKENVIIFTSSNRSDSFGGADLYCSKTDSNGKWLQAVNLGKNFNTKSREFCPSFSPDSKFFFFSSERDVKWISARYLNEQIATFW